MCRSGKRSELGHMTERTSNNRKASSLILGSVTFSLCWFKKYSAFHSSCPVIIMVEEIFYLKFQLIPWIFHGLRIICLSLSFKSAMCRMRRKANTSNVGMYWSGNHSEIAQVALG